MHSAAQRRLACQQQHHERSQQLPFAQPAAAGARRTGTAALPACSLRLLPAACCSAGFLFTPAIALRSCTIDLNGNHRVAATVPLACRRRLCACRAAECWCQACCSAECWRQLLHAAESLPHGRCAAAFWSSQPRKDLSWRPWQPWMAVAGYGHAESASSVQGNLELA